jgi:alkylated DNA repair dioxygenase AlkB
MNGFLHIEDCFINNQNYFEILKSNVVWDNSLKSRKTASYGVPYIYNGVSYDLCPFPEFISSFFLLINSKVGFTPNNCLLNYYDRKESSMGFHSDQTNILNENCGIVIISFGAPRVLRFKHKSNSSIIDFNLENGSFFFMGQDVQNNWLHSILTSELDNNERISLSFRSIKYL